MKSLKQTSFIMLMLILCQSFSAVGKYLDFHTLDAVHLQHKHDHAEHGEKSATKYMPNVGVEQTSDHHNPADCHHCGHCHGSHAQWVGEHDMSKLQLMAISHHFDYLDAIIDAPINRLLRPPKFHA